MQRESLGDCISPTTTAALEVVSIEKGNESEVIEGTLRDTVSGQLIPVYNAIPRFVKGSNYADSFGIQWNRYRRIQLDSFNGSTLTRDRFYEGSGWTSRELEGKKVLEAGCGAGRFSETILATGAQLYSFDYSSAVDAAWLNNHSYPKWNLCQADIYGIPFRPSWFDYVFCYGVLQHTPNPKRAFLNLVRYLKPGGKIAIDIYVRETQMTKLAVKYWYRPFTKKIPSHLLLKIFESYLPFWMPIDSFLGRIPKLGRFLTVWIPCWNKSNLPLDRKHQIEWTVLDTFDAFSCEFDQPQTVPEVQTWFEEAGLTDIKVRPGGNGILGNGRKKTAKVEAL